MNVRRLPADSNPETGSFMNSRADWRPDFLLAIIGSRCLRPTNRALDLLLAVVDGRMYVINGGPSSGGSFSRSNEVFTPPDT